MKKENSTAKTTETAKTEKNEKILDAKNKAVKTKTAISKKTANSENLIENIDLNGIELLGIKNPDATKAPVLFIHGISCGAWIWQEYFLDWFKDNGFNPYALSLRNHGDSKKTLFTHQTTLEDYISDVEASIDYIRKISKKDPLIVGHSMGGFLAQKVALRQRIKGLVLLCSAPPQGLIPLMLDVMQVIPSPFDFVKTSAYLAGFIHNLPRKLRGIFLATDVPKEDIIRYDDLIHPELDSYTAFLQMNLGVAELLFKKPDVPVVVIGATKDKIVPKNTVELTALTYGVKPIWLEDLGHCVMLETTWLEAAELIKSELDKILTSV